MIAGLSTFRRPFTKQAEFDFDQIPGSESVIIAGGNCKRQPRANEKPRA